MYFDSNQEMQHLMQETSPQSAAAVTALLAMRNGRMAGYPRPQQSFQAALDLCIRRRDRTPPPSPDYLEDQQVLDSTPSTTTRPSTSSSPISHPGSERSDSSISSLDNITLRPVNYSTPIPTTSRAKPTRPFKAYPKDPLVLSEFPVGLPSPDFTSESSTEGYIEFRNRMLSQVKSSQGITNKNMRRSTVVANAPEDPSKNEAYWEKRRKNNEAAKRSRDARRAKEDEIAIRAAFLEHENMKLKFENETLKKETERLRAIAYNRR